MSPSTALSPSYNSAVLPYRGMQAVYVQAIFISMAIALPVVAHAVNAPIRYVLPMHWPVLLAGLLYGWRAGAVTGILAPLVSYAVSGFPLPAILPSMTAELFVYGFATGMLRQRFNVNAFLSIGASIAAGRIIFILTVILTGSASVSDTGYFTAALMPGLVAALLQIVSIPLLSHSLMKNFHADDVK
jgi:niacin transporter